MKYFQNIQKWKYGLIFLIVFQFFPLSAISAQEKPINENISEIEISGLKMSLLNALHFSLSYNSDIRLQKETARELEGSFLQAKGEFDTSLILNLTGGFVQKELTYEEWREEVRKRETLRVLSEVADRIARGGEPSDDIIVVIDGILLETMGPSSVENYEDESEITSDINKEITSECAGQLYPYDSKEYWECVSSQSREKLSDLGPIPSATENYSWSVKLSVQKPFRNGIVVTPRIVVDMENKQFRDKPRSTRYGGTGENERYTSNIGIDITVPLGKGWGKKSTGAAEKAAKYNYESAEFEVRHIVSQSVLEVCKAYWKLVAAQQRYQLWNNSKAWLQNQLVKATEAMIEGDELPKAELARAMARAQTVYTAVTRTRREMNQARLELARKIGMNIQSIEAAPYSTDSFPAPASISTLNTFGYRRLFEEGLQNRADYKAKSKLTKATRTLLIAARKDTKFRKDLELSMYYQGNEHDSVVLEGLEGAVIEKLTGPSIMLTFTFDWPFNNRQAKGFVKEAHASWKKSIINLYELERRIETGIVKTWETLLDTSQQIQLMAESAEYYSEVNENTLESFRLKIMTLIDVINTEEQVTDTYLQLVDAKLAYAIALSELRYETGTLISYDAEKYWLNDSNLLTIPIIHARKQPPIDLRPWEKRSGPPIANSKKSTYYSAE